MRALLLVVALAGLAAPDLGAQDTVHAAVFEQAVDAYRRGDFAEARVRWESLLDEELTASDRARLCYDLGNAEWRDGDHLRAIGWYTACLRLDPRHPDAWANLEFARSEEGFDPADRGDLRSTARRLLTSWRPAERRLLVLLGVMLLAIPMAVEAFRGGRLWRRASLLALGMLVLLSLPWLHGLTSTDGDPLLVIRTSTLSLRSEPRLELPSTVAVEPAAVVQRIDELPGWVRVETGDHEKGWLQEEAVFALRR